MSENRRLVRAQEGRIVTGVCAGLGRHTHIDPVVFRVGFSVLTLMAGGTGIFLYVAAYLLMPETEADVSVAERVLKRRFDGDAVLAVLGGLLSASVMFSILGGGLGGGPASGPLTVVTVSALALLVAHARGVNIVQVARTLPERLQGTPYRQEDRPPPPPPAPTEMIDLATLRPVADKTWSGSTRVLPTETLSPGTLSPEPMDDLAEPPDKAPESCGGSGLTPLTLFAALAAGAATVPFTTHQSLTTKLSIAIAATLAAIGVGLIIASWYGRSRGLVSLGVVLCLALVTTSAVGTLPQGTRWGEVTWRPVTAQAEQSYKLAIGTGTLDLTGLPLRDGQRVQVHAEAMLGELTVTVPGTAQTEVHARSALGDVTVDGKITSGSPGARVDTVLPAVGQAAGKTPKNPPVIELHVRGRVTDVEVNRA